MKRLTCIVALAALAAALLPLTAPATESFRAVYEKGAGDFVTDLVIGSDDETADDFLMAPTGFCVAPGGDIFVLEMQTCRILRFDADGNLLATFGEEGEGPGFLRLPTHMEIAPDGMVWIYEVGNRRFSVFTPQGEFVTSHALDDIAWGFGVAPDGNVIVELHEWDYEGKKGGTTIRIKRYPDDLSSGAVIDSALIKDNTYITKPIRTNVPVPFHPNLAWGIQPHGNLVVATSADYHIRVLSPNGEVVADVTHEGVRQKVTEENREAHFANITYNVGDVIKKGAPQYTRDATEFPEFKPYFQNIRVDSDGNILVATYDHNGDRTVYDAFDPAATFINRVVLPDLGDAVFSGGYVYRLRVPDDGPAVVERLRLVAGQDAAP